MIARSAIALALFAAGCGGGAATADRQTAKPRTETRARTDVPRSEPPPAPDERAGSTDARGAQGERPLLSMYVRGPRAEGPEPGVYAADFVVINTGDASADVSHARARFEAWRGDRRIDCEPLAEVIEGPETLAPGTAFTYRAAARCDLGPGEHEVRAYLSFSAEGADLHREQHVVPSTTSPR